MKQSMVMGLAAALAMAAWGTVSAQTPQDYVGAPPAHWHEVDTDFMKAFKNPMEGLEMGLDLRLRQVFAKNILTLDDDFGGAINRNHYTWQRYRTRWSTKLHLDENITFNTRLVWEFWTHCRPKSHPGIFGNRDTEFDEAIFDNFNIQFRNAFDLPLTVTVGRQDIMLGTWWLVQDGTPGEGSRTFFFDAIRAEYKVSDTAKLDLIYIQQYDDESKWLKPFNHGSVRERRHLTQNQDEKGVILYLTNKVSDMISFDAYYMFKQDEKSSWARRWGKLGNDQETNVLGGRLFGNLDKNWSYSAEAAYQFGKFKADGGSSVDHRAFGTNNKLQYAFNNDLDNKIYAGYEFLSGDDPGTDKNEAFNTMWGDWPQMQRGGDLQAYIWNFDNGVVAEITNLHRFGVGHSFKPHKEWTLATDWNLLWADQKSNANQGSFRGHMLTGWLTYQCCKNFRTHFLVDYFIPGSYYPSPGGDEAMFARVNMEWTF